MTISRAHIRLADSKRTDQDHLLAREFFSAYPNQMGIRYYLLRTLEGRLFLAARVDLHSSIK